ARRTARARASGARGAHDGAGGPRARRWTTGTRQDEAMSDKPKLAVGQRWRTRDGEIVTVNESWFEGRNFADDLIELIQDTPAPSSNAKPQSIATGSESGGVGVAELVDALILATSKYANEPDGSSADKRAVARAAIIERFEALELDGRVSQDAADK